jgi:orotidine-5'-phosphate decarboxylase
VISNFADRLMAAIAARGTPACVGLDPLPEKLPRGLKPIAEAGADSNAQAILQFGRGVIEAIAAMVPAIKINIAFFEPFGEHGLRAYSMLIREAHAAGLMVIGDVKRGDIGHTSGQYAKAHLSDGPEGSGVADAITVNPYFGSEGVSPFVEAAQVTGRGLFVLVQTSNESAAQVQGLELPNGLTVCQEVARLVQDWASADGLIGSGGYSCVGAVVSPRDLESTARIRELMPNCIFLVPGFGAQGRTVDEVATCFTPDGTGAIVTASRSVIYAYDEPKYRDAGPSWKEAVRAGCRDFVESLRQVLG